MTERNETFVLWQLLDSAFPTGGFAHSSGLEAMLHCRQIGDIAALRQTCRQSVKQVAAQHLPFVYAAFQSPQQAAQLDGRFSILAMNHAARRASVTQGRSLLRAVRDIFSGDQLHPGLELLANSGCHLPVVFGAIAAVLDLNRNCIGDAYLFCHVRGLTAAAIRLGVVGPTLGQRLQRDLGTQINVLAQNVRSVSVDNAFQTQPLLEIFQGVHDRLPWRLFVS